ncbi:hypothetical protein KDW_26870 [Dictyobacter vulcani]|uniref:3-keto-disaccharide hydrolase domain-containing protein n=2 Tax=Dictyobacter vulcani TaxID=2607529 RepID=A0A5J4KKZ8_9CHLR|nr:hypothetical protein KDW_26870 [Dictyobacter vulcani]
MEFEEVSDRKKPSKNFNKNFRSKRSLLVYALLVLMLGSGMIGYATAYRPYMQQRQKEELIRSRIIQTVQARATHAAQLSATVQAQAQATATSVAYHQKNYSEMTSSSPDLNDDLHNPDIYNWDTGSGCSFTTSSYSASVSQKGFFLPCLAQHTQLNNFVYQVDMTILKGDAGGLIVRAHDDNSRSYIFVVGQDGSYSIYYYASDSKNAAQPLAEGYSEHISTGQHKENTLGVLASGSSLDFYINKKYVASVMDTTLGSGQIGVLANSYKHTTEVIYSHARVWKF